MICARVKIFLAASILGFLPFCGCLLYTSKRCNDFGAGGVSVAIGELADGLSIDLNAVPKKYNGLDGTISTESGGEASVIRFKILKLVAKQTRK